MGYLTWIVSTLSIALMLVRPFGLSEAYWATGGAIFLILLGLVPIPIAAQAITQGKDVYLFLVGMMMLSELARQTGVFEWIAGVAAKHARGSASRLFLLVFATGTGVTALLSNDATAVVLTPAVLTIVQRLKVDPKPYLIACALIANAASFILPISNPANLVIFNSHMPPLLTWLETFWLPSVFSVITTLGCLLVIFRQSLSQIISEQPPQEKLTSGGKLAVGGPFRGRVSGYSFGAQLATRCLDRCHGFGGSGLICISRSKRSHGGR